MRTVLIAGGTGGAKLAAGFQAEVAAGELTVICNTGDDDVFHGLHVSPDVDSVLFRLAGIFNEATGFGVAGDTFNLLGQLRDLGEPAWFWLGDRDLAFHVLRTSALARGARLTEATLDLCRRLGLPSRVLPMTDAPVRTWFATDAGCLPFQEYYVRERAQPAVHAVEYAGIEAATAAPEVVAALAEAELVVIGPSNPVVSTWPVLTLVREHLDPSRTVAVSPVVGGRALKGPTVEMMLSLGRDPSPLGVAREYRGLAGGFVIDSRDAGARDPIAGLGYRVLVTDTVMDAAESAAGLARAILESRS